MSSRTSSQDRSKAKAKAQQRPALERIGTAPAYEDLDVYLNHPLLRNTSNNDILQDHIYLRGQRASSNLSSTSIDSIIKDSTASDIEKTRKRLSDAEESTASYEEQGESGHSDASVATLPSTAYVPGPSRSEKGKAIDYSATADDDPKLMSLGQCVYSTLRKEGDIDRRMLFYHTDKYPVEEMYERITDAKDSLDAMLADFIDVLEFLHEHVGWTYRSAVAKKICDTVDQIHDTCNWMRETIEAQEKGKHPAGEDSKLDDP